MRSVKSIITTTSSIEQMREKELTDFVNSFDEIIKDLPESTVKLDIVYECIRLKQALTLQDFPKMQQHIYEIAAQFSKIDTMHKSILIAAIELRIRKLQFAKQLIMYNLSDVHASDCNGQTVFQYALETRDLELLELLVLNGVKKSQEESILHDRILAEHKKAVHGLTSIAPDKRTHEYVANLMYFTENHRNPTDGTPIFLRTLLSIRSRM